MFWCNIGVWFLLYQIHFKGQTLEDHSMTWVQNSSIGLQLQKSRGRSCTLLGEKAAQQTKENGWACCWKRQCQSRERGDSSSRFRLNMQWERSKDAAKIKPLNLNKFCTIVWTLMEIPSRGYVFPMNMTDLRMPYFSWKLLKISTNECPQNTLIKGSRSAKHYHSNLIAYFLYISTNWQTGLKFAFALYRKKSLPFFDPIRFLFGGFLTCGNLFCWDAFENFTFYDNFVTFNAFCDLPRFFFNTLAFIL